MKRARISVIWILFVAYFFLLMGSAHGFVLCLGENGHIAIEAAQNGGCKPLPSDFSRSDPPPSGHVISDFMGKHCGNCLDFVVPTAQIYRTSTHIQTLSFTDPQRYFTLMDSVGLLSGRPQGVVPSSKRFYKDLTATLLQTTVLLI